MTLTYASVIASAVVAMFASTAGASTLYKVHVPVPSLALSSPGSGGDKEPETPEPSTPEVSLKSGALPAAFRNSPFSYSFLDNLVIVDKDGDGKTQPEFSVLGALPAGLTLTAAGQLAGTPSKIAQGKPFDIQVNYFDARATTSYTLDVGGKPFQAKTVFSGNSHVCAITPESGLYCWGFNNFGQLGDGTLNDSAVPVAVKGLESGVSQVVLGWQTTCAVHNGALKCWGANSVGQLGDGTNADRSAPGLVTGMTSGIEDLTLAQEHTCAKQNGKAYCWGRNDNGQLGDGTLLHRNVPTPVLKLSSNVTQLVSSWRNTCAIDGGAVYCWGRNTRANPNVGGLASLNVSTPTLVAGLESGATWITSGRFGAFHTCAIKNSALMCWGNNSRGILGIPADAVTGVSAPMVVAGAEAGVTWAVAGGNFTCVQQSGSYKCMGENAAGQLGLGHMEPVGGWVAAPQGESISQMSPGGAMNCVREGSNVSCWGSNESSQAGLEMSDVGESVPSPNVIYR